MNPTLEETFESLSAWCRERDFKGSDPFDGLNSRLFNATPFQRSRIGRLAWLQLHKRSPVDLRRIAAVPPGENSKGTALFALAYLSRFEATGDPKYKSEAEYLLNRLIALRVKGVKGTAWGYDFDWQNRAFLARKGTPTIVPTAFAVRALMSGAEVLGNQEFRSIASAAAEFIQNDLNVTFESEGEICWSYSPFDHTRVLNASLLAAETLALIASDSNKAALCELAIRGARFVCRRQRVDGSWIYGEADFQSWADNFHTAFILYSLSKIIRLCGSAADELRGSLSKGYEFWISNFFGKDGWPNYFPRQRFPADSHSTGAALVCFEELSWLDQDALSKARRTARWAIENMRDPKGYFYYQRRRRFTLKIPYMRWTEAWMLYGLARLLHSKSDTNDSHTS